MQATVIVCRSGRKGWAGKLPGAPGRLDVTQGSHEGWLGGKANARIRECEKGGVLLLGRIAPAPICGHKSLAGLFCKVARLFVR